MTLYSYDRRRSNVNLTTPADMGKALEHALSSHFAGHYFEVKAERGVSIKAGRMGEEEFAKKGLTEGYSKVGVNPVAMILILPDQGNAWTSLTVKSASGNGDETLKQVGVSPIRKASKLTPDKAFKLVEGFFTQNASKLKSGGDTKTAYNYDRRRI